MNNYVIFADSACDIVEETLSEWGVKTACLTFRFNDSEKEYLNSEMPIKDFYEKMRAGGVAKTAAVNSETFVNSFEDILKNGSDILYLGFSSGLSTTYNSARIASLELKEKYPERRISVVDTLCASAGFGLLLKMIVDKKAAGATLDEACSYAEKMKLHICHWFTVDDLVYLKRGGRVSATSAFVGNLLGIKPVMHVDNEGHLVPVNKVRGRKTSVTALADKLGELVTDGDYEVFISHGDCIGDAEFLAKYIEDKFGKKTSIITNVGPVIGAHSGPGTLALFFVGNNR